MQEKSEFFQAVAKDLQENLKISTINFEKSPENNGGKTGYYDLPLPDRDKLIDILNWVSKTNWVEVSVAADRILALCPQTLNDLIEYKNMEPWRHEVMKACYALDERAVKASDGSSSAIREINKMEYYIQRGKQVLSSIP
jgi:hypothetical protein